MAQITNTVDVGRTTEWHSAERDDEVRWPLYKTALFVVASSALLWSGIFALVGWLW